MSYALAYIQYQKKRESSENFRKPKQYFSNQLGDTYIITDEGEVVFSSGVRYTKKELNQVKGLNEQDLKWIHLIKKVFKGEIIEY